MEYELIKVAGEGGDWRDYHTIRREVGDIFMPSSSAGMAGNAK